MSNINQRINTFTINGEAKARGDIDIATITASVTSKNASGPKA